MGALANSFVVWTGMFPTIDVSVLGNVLRRAHLHTIHLSAYSPFTMARKKKHPSRSSNTSTTTTLNAKESWKDSKSKSILRVGILSGEITEEMKPKQVYQMREDEHGKWVYTNWANNLRNLRATIKSDKERLMEDLAAYGHDIAIVKQQREGQKLPWHKSPAAKLLKDDVKAGLDETKKPKQLHASRDEYKQEFGLTEFRKHIYQERDSKPKRDLRFERKKNAWKYPEIHKAHPRLQDK